MLSNKGTLALVYYWYQGRGREESSEYVVKWDLLKDAALYGRTEEALVRIVVPINADARGYDAKSRKASVDAANAIAEGVARELRTAAEHVIPKWAAAG